MDTTNILWRIVIAVVVVIVLFALIPLVLGLLAIPNSATIDAILRIVIGASALLYIITGNKWFA